MANPDTPVMIAGTRTVRAQAILNNTADLRGYPYRHLAVLSHGLGHEQVRHALMAAEVLDQYGWELLNVAEFGSSNQVYAFLRRR